VETAGHLSKLTGQATVIKVQFTNATATAPLKSILHTGGTTVSKSEDAGGRFP
jgi:hypothetical protein